MMQKKLLFLFTMLLAILHVNKIICTEMNLQQLLSNATSAARCSSGMSGLITLSALTAHKMSKNEQEELLTIALSNSLYQLCTKQKPTNLLSSLRQNSQFIITNGVIHIATDAISTTELGQTIMEKSGYNSLPVWAKTIVKQGGIFAVTVALQVVTDKAYATYQARQNDYSNID